MQDEKVPQAARDQDARQSALAGDSRVLGFYYGGKVYINAQGVHSLTELTTAILHESLGHHGLQNLYGSELTAVLDMIVSRNREMVEAKARSYGLKTNSRQHMRKAAEEVLAEIAQTRPQSTYVTKLVDLIRRFLRQIPGLSGLKLSRSELIEQFVLPAQGWVERGNPNAPGMSASGAASFLFGGVNSRTAPEVDTDPTATEPQWWRGPDNLWRYEIDDSTGTFDPSGAFGRLADAAYHGEESLRLDEVLDHPELFEAYPEVRGLQVFKDSQLPDNADAMFDGVSEISLDPNSPDPEASLLHELQHWIQNQEDFGRGGNTESAVRALPPERKKRLFAKVIAEAEQDKAYLDMMYEQAQQEGDYEAIDRLELQLEDVELAIGVLKSGNIDALIAEMKDTPGMQDVAHAAYEKLAGEGEARTVEIRKGLDPAQRRRTSVRGSEAAVGYDRDDTIVTKEEVSPTEEEGPMFMRLPLSQKTQDDLKVTFKRAKEKLRKYLQRNWVSGGFMKSVDALAASAGVESPFDTYVRGEGAKNVGEEQTAFILHGFRKALTKAYGVRSYESVPEADRVAINDYLQADPHDPGNPEGRALAKLPQDKRAQLKEAADVLRAQLDVLSHAMLEAHKELFELEMEKYPADVQERYLQDLWNAELNDDPALAESVPAKIRTLHSMMQTIGQNKGKYLHRSYEAYDNPDRGRDVEEKDPQLWEEGKAYFMDQALRSLASKAVGSGATDREQKLAAAAAYLAGGAADPILSTEQVQRLDDIRHEVPDDDAITRDLRQFFQSAKDADPYEHLIRKGVMAGSKDTSMLKRRKDVPEVIRRLLGEYTDPVLNYAASASKMQWFLGNHHFLTNLYRNGKGVFLFNKGEGPANVAEAQITSPGNNSMNPLDGMYTTEDFRQGLMDAVDRNNYEGFFRGLIQFNAYVKYGKTLLSPTTQFRNFWSAAMFTVMNGHMITPERLRKAFSAARADLFTKDEAWSAYLQDLIAKGVLHDNPYAGELRDAIKDALESNVYVPGARGALRRGAKWIQSAYQVGDDFWKIVGYESEFARQKEHGLSDEKAADRAAYLIRNGYPTYSLVPRAVKGLRRFPLVGTFVSFPAEIVRTTKNQVLFAADEWSKGNRDLAAKRMLGMATAVAATAALSRLSAALLGLDEDDEERMRMMVPHWSRNSQLLHWGLDEDGLPQYLDMSFIDPYAYVKKPFIALMNGNYVTATDKAMAALGEALAPFVGPDITAGAVGEVLFNQKIAGGSVYNPEDPANYIAGDVLNHIRKAVQPGVFSNVERMALALQGEHTRTGKSYNVGDEAAALFGVRFSTVNIPQSLRYHAYGFNDSLRSATRILSYVAGDQGSVTDAELESAADRSLYARTKAFKLMARRVEAARALGVQEVRIRAALKSSGVSKKNIDAVMAGEIEPWTMSRQFIKSATEGALVSTPNQARRQEVTRQSAERKQKIQTYMAEKQR